MSDGLWLRNYPWRDVQRRLEPTDDSWAAVDADDLLKHAELSVELQWADRGRVSGLVGKST
ncbi:hypothetical protein [Nonomuraea indica]|uniref:hypothetical protein n=1 Tax=Nonomuraea indica TaxID=1581193 RepID=UPI000C7CDA41|nr:hypothetical protein [Nonomuraea indica]